MARLKLPNNGSLPDGVDTELVMRLPTREVPKAASSSYTSHPQEAWKVEMSFM
jgi:hypothetical protein